MAQQNPQAPSTLHRRPSLADAMDDAADMPPSRNNDLSIPLASDDTETDEDGMLDALSFSPPARVYTPPPHIAARFHRTSVQARRKGSAASSRRNSISSTHSRSSHGYGAPNGNPQSKHVAQHLRRASILADRKARLADRAAHAEQVRLRAALAKAAVRDISASEERALAAAQAREKNLAEIAAACAEEVKRAKAVAETMKEKREQDLHRLRQQIQDRLDEAERRREELRRNNTAGRARTRGQSIANNGRKQVEVMPQVAEVKETSSPQDQDATQDNASQMDGTLSQDQSGNNTPTPALTEDEAAFKVLQWWRKNHRRKAIAEFQQLGLAVDGVRDTSFEEVVELLGRDKVLMTTGKVLRLCGIQEGKTSSVKEIVVVRAFLSAFLILGHPTEVLTNKEDKEAGAMRTTAPGSFSSPASPRNANHSSGEAKGDHRQHRQDQVGRASTLPQPASSLSVGKDNLANPQLQELVGKAKDLLICFETIVSRLGPANNYTPPPALASELVEAYDCFYDAFIAWKARDASALVEVMVMQFVELDAIWQTVKDGTDTSVSDTYRESIQQNQLLLMVRIKKLAGAEAGKKKVVEAVRKARKAKAEANKKAAAANSNMKPREADHATIETAMGDLAGDSSRTGNNSKSGSSGENTSAASGASTSKPATTGSPVDDATIARMLPQSKPDSESRAEAKLHHLRSGTPSSSSDDNFATSPLPENRVVVHELAINQNYRISDTQFRQQQAAWMAPVFARMRKTMPSADKGSSSNQEQDEHFYYLLTIAEIIRSKLERMTAPGKKMHQFIGELLDTELAQRQFAVGSFSYERFFMSIGQLLPKLCAPVRDDEVKELIEVTLHQGDYVDRLQALLSFVDVMVTDHVNFMISVAAPRLLLSATEYETQRFAELVDGDKSGFGRLPSATAAWRTARSKVLAEAAKRDPEGINHPKSRPTPDQFYTQMLVDVFTQLSPIPLNEMPEMLWLDHARAQKWGAATRRIVTAGAVLLQCKNLLKRDVRLPWKAEAHRVMMVLEKAEKDALAPPSKGNISDSDSATSSPTYAATRLRTALTASSTVDGVMAALESGRSMPPATRIQLRTIVQRTLAASADVAVARLDNPDGGDAVPQEPVLRLLLHRLRGYLVARLAALSSSVAEKVRQANGAGERLTSLGLAEFVDRVREMVEETARISAIDRETHNIFWDRVDTEVAAEGDAMAGNRAASAA